MIQKTKNRINMKKKSPPKLKLCQGAGCACHDRSSDYSVTKKWGIILLTPGIFHPMIFPREASLTGTE